eukprot:3196119-Prymnesium_polylepis.1
MGKCYTYWELHPGAPNGNATAQQDRHDPPPTRQGTRRKSSGARWTGPPSAKTQVSFLQTR